MRLKKWEEVVVSHELSEKFALLHVPPRQSYHSGLSRIAALLQCKSHRASNALA